MSSVTLAHNVQVFMNEGVERTAKLSHEKNYAGEQNYDLPTKPIL
ncbi:MAG: hypothetical protein SFY32_14400 [Bacteroidota bacterium]|nr:hypothetical protein [Bacteroidota bacterium]